MGGAGPGGEGSPRPSQRPRLPWKLTSVVAGVSTGVGHGMGLRVVGLGWRAMVHLLAVTTETQARNTQPFLTLGPAGLAARAMAGGSRAPGEALCQCARPPPCPPQGSRAPECLDPASPA